MVQSGTIYDIIQVDQNTIKILLNKKEFGKPYLSAVTYWGYWKKKADELRLRPKDKIKTNVIIVSKEYNGKYYDTQRGKQIYVVSKAPIKVDMTTGELFD